MYIEELVGALPPGVVVVDREFIEGYRMDRALDRKAGVPLAVVRAETTEQVQIAVRWAASHAVSIVPRGAGTGLSGGSTAVEGGIVISTERMRAMKIDVVTRMAIAQPGLLNREVKTAAEEVGLWYPPDPASFEICSIGGNVATNAGGLCCVKYGMTSDYVLGLQVVLSDGRAVRVGGPRLKDAAGLSLTKFFVGSEGTLGIITEITLRLLPSPPPARTVVGWFSSTKDAVGAILEVASQLRASMLEYMDCVTVNAVEDDLAIGLNRDAAALVVARSDDLDPSGAEVKVMLQAFRDHNPIEVFEARDEEEGERYAGARRAAIPAVELKGRLLLGDVGVAIPALPALIAGIESIALGNDVTIALIAHAGDGNTHPLIVFDPHDPYEEARAYKAYGEIMDIAIELGGTITGEHGVGRLKQPWLATQVGDGVIDISTRIKHALDPQNIMNPGAVFALP